MRNTAMGLLRPRKASLLLIAVIIYIYSDAISGAYIYGTNASGLITLASLRESEHTINPFSKDAVLISPRVAQWLLLNFDWPYNQPIERKLACEEEQSYIQQAIAARNEGPENRGSNMRMARLVEHFVGRGYSIEETYCGYTPLQSAILYGDLEMVEWLIGHGADPYTRIQRPGRKVDGLDSFEFAEWLLDGRFPEVHEPVFAYLTSIRELN